MIYLLTWWLAVSAVGAACLPICFRLFSSLPDRGYALARVLGTVLTGYVVWLLAALHLLPFGRWSLLLACGLLATAGLALAVRDRHAIAKWCVHSRRYILLAEAVFIAAFAILAVVRSDHPEIAAGTERPFAYGLYNSVVRSRWFPPPDPWLSGEPTAYYYVGYVLVATEAKLTNTAPPYAFNLGLCLFGALAAIAAFGLATNCLCMLDPRRSLTGRVPLAAGVAAPVLLLVMGNLEGAVELLAAHDRLPHALYGVLHIAGLHPWHSRHWYPDLGDPQAWVRAIRLGSEQNIMEMPVFNAVLGNLHPHWIALPFRLLGAGIALALASTPKTRRQRLARTITAGLVLGLFLAVNPWDYPLIAFLMMVCLVAGDWRGIRGSLAPVVGQAAAVVGLSFVFFAPYLIHARANLQGLRATEAIYRPPRIDLYATFLPLQHLALFWLPLILPATLYCLAIVGRSHHRKELRRVLAIAACVAIPALFWGVATAHAHGLTGLQRELAARHLAWLTPVLVGLLVVVAGWGVVIVAERGVDARRQAQLFLLSAILTAGLCIFMPEFWYLKDLTGYRVNTVFKAWYCGWVLLAVAADVGGMHLLGQLRGIPARARPWLAAGLATSALAIAGALVYPAIAISVSSETSTGPRTLDGLAFLRQQSADEYGAVTWLNAHATPGTIILEAYGDSGSDGGRFSSRTGLPTLLEWFDHEAILRGVTPALNQRYADIRELYGTMDLARAAELLTRYRVRYVIVGSLELRTYGTAGMAKFAQLGQLEYVTPSVKIYRVAGGP